MNNTNLNSGTASQNQLIAMNNIILELRETRVFGLDLEWEFGYNQKSGNVWCWLPEHNVTIAAADFDPYRVKFYVQDEEGEDEEFDTFEEAYKEAIK